MFSSRSPRSGTPRAPTPFDFRAPVSRPSTPNPGAAQNGVAVGAQQLQQELKNVVSVTDDAELQLITIISSVGSHLFSTEPDWASDCSDGPEKNRRLAQVHEIYLRRRLSYEKHLFDFGQLGKKTNVAVTGFISDMVPQDLKPAVYGNLFLQGRAASSEDSDIIDVILNGRTTPLYVDELDRTNTLIHSFIRSSHYVYYMPTAFFEQISF